MLGFHGSSSFGMGGGAGQGPGSASGLPGAGNRPVSFGSKGERAGSFSYVHRALHPLVWSPAAPRCRLMLAVAAASRDQAAAGLRWWFPMER